jgi:predicted AAA+ superfamily ATPase
MTENIYSLGYQTCRDHLLERLAQAAPARIQLLSGPRQVGKTTLLLEIADHLGPAALYIVADGPEALLPGFWERSWTRAVEMADEHGKAFLLIDEIQHVHRWDERLKSEWDRVHRRKTPLHVVATGSSALGIGRGSRESLAGRFERLVLSHWSATAISAAFEIKPRQAVDTYVNTGGYPGSLEFLNDPARWRAYVRDAIVEPAIGRDILALGAVRRPALLRQIFSLCTNLPAQIVSLQKLQGQLQDPGALETIASYLKLLEDAFLVAGLEKFSHRPLRRRMAPPKIVVLNNALLSVMHPDGTPNPSREPERFGNWVENACLSYAWNAGQRVLYWREEPLEVDAVFEGTWGRWVAEVKTGECRMNDLRGLLEFNRRHPEYQPLAIVGKERDVERIEASGIRALHWREFLLSAGPSR